MFKVFGNLKISIKLVSVVIFVALFIAAVGFLGMNDMNKINNRAMLLHDHNLKTIEDINSLKENYLEIKIALLQITYEAGQDSDKNEKNIKQINDLTKKNEELFVKIKEANGSIRVAKSKEDGEKDKNTIEKIDSSAKEYLDDSMKIVNFVGVGDYKSAISEIAKISEVSETLIQELGVLNNAAIEDSDRIYVANNDTYTNSKLIIVVTVLGFICSIALGLLTAISISRELKKVVDFAGYLGSGDLTKDIDINSKDEVGELAKALNKAKENMQLLISEIINSSSNISATSEELSATSEEVSAKMDMINQATEQITKGIHDLSATTSQVNASTENYCCNRCSN